MHFGKLLAKLRTDRGLTQEELAKAAGTSTPSIQRWESAEKCQLRPTNAKRLFKALEAEGRLSPIETENFYFSAGLETLAKLAAEESKRRAETVRASAESVRRSAFAFNTEASPLHTRAHTWLERVLEDLGPERTLEALDGVARILGVKPPSQERTAGAWTYHTGPLDAGEGLTAEIHAPVDPHVFSARAKASPKRRTGA